MFPIARNLFLYLAGSLLINQIRMKTTLRIFRILFKLLLFSYVAVVNIILISAFYVLLLAVVEWVSPSSCRDCLPDTALRIICLFIAFLYGLALYSVQPFTAERMADADERGLQTAGR